MNIRKLVTMIEETRIEQGRALVSPVRHVLVAAVIVNPHAGLLREDLTSLYADGEDLGRQLVAVAKSMLPGNGVEVQAYGKGAMVGLDGELEHAAALLHPLFGSAVRVSLSQAAAIMPSTAKRAAAGASLDIPLQSVIDPWSFDHFDTMTLCLADAPRPDEIVVALVVADQGRPLARTRTVR